MSGVLQGHCDLWQNVAHVLWLLGIERLISHYNGELNDDFAIERLCLFIALSQFRTKLSHELLGLLKGIVSAFQIRSGQSVLDGLLYAGPTSRERFVNICSRLVERVHTLLWSSDRSETTDIMRINGLPHAEILLLYGFSLVWPEGEPRLRDLSF